MTVYQNQNYAAQDDSTKYVEYDLNAEKKRIADGTEEIKKELLEKWHQTYANAQIFPSTIANFNPELLSFLLSFEHTHFYNQLAQKFNLTQQQRDVLPQIIWSIARNRNWQELNNLLQDNLKVDSSAIISISELLNTRFLAKIQELSSSNATISANTVSSHSQSITNTIDLNLADAMKAYPEIGEQLITADKIKILSFPEPVRPSVKNWLADYTSAFGQDNHSAIIRGNYLFHSSNAKKLDSGDRQKLAYVLKAFDEKSPITVDKSAKQIVFSLSATSNAKAQPFALGQTPSRLSLETRNASELSSNVDNTKAKPLEFAQEQSRFSLGGAQQAPASKISFSSPQRLSYERTNETPKKPTEIMSAVNRPQMSANAPTQKTFGKNVVNLKDI